MPKGMPILLLSAFALLSCALFACSAMEKELGAEGLLTGGITLPPASSEPGKDETPEENAVNRITITVGDRTFTATLAEAEAARALAGLLPVTVTMKELNGNEKYFYMDGSLPAEAVSPGTIRAGDLMLYGSDCLVLFYESFSTAYQYTPLGHIDEPEGLAQAAGTGSVQVSFSR